MTMVTNITTQVPLDVAVDLKRLAELEKISISKAVRQAIISWVGAKKLNWTIQEQKRIGALKT